MGVSNNSSIQNSDIEIDASAIAKQMRSAAYESITEEDLRIRFENILRIEVCEPLGIPWARYERRTVASGLRSDALYGNVILEYKKPNSFVTLKNFQKSIDQLKKYIEEEAKKTKTPFNQFLGIAIDGFQIGFLRYVKSLKKYEIQGPIQINSHSALRMLEALRGLARKPLYADIMVKDFGPGSTVAKTVIKCLYERLLSPKSQRTLMLFSDWSRVFSQVCAYSPKKIKGLEQIYGIKENEIDYDALLFSVHTYYALVMKLLAAEVAVLFGGFFLKSYTKKLQAAHMKSFSKLKTELELLEEGGIFINLGIENFLEADYFAWYLDEWNIEIANSVALVIEKLSEYEPGTAELEPDAIRDLFKIMYQNLVPKKTRHDLGEYYTPDWLAEFLLNESGFTQENFERIGKRQGLDAPLKLRLLDPACGSGTFLVLAIKRIKEYAKKHYLEEKALVTILKNVVGFDLNPLAVIASRTNYLLALGELMRSVVTPMEIPVYFTDSILTQKRSTFGNIEYTLKTSVGTFAVPVCVVETGLLNKTLSLIEECVHHRTSRNEFKERLKMELNLVDENELSFVANLFSRILTLEKKGKNKIWTRVLKNSFAPLFAGKFNFVIGNPPWINWENLPRDYREQARHVYDRYRLITWTSKVGAVKTDLSVLFTYVCLDRYLENNGTLGFLITQSILKSESGNGFRRFSIVAKDPHVNIKTLKAHDMVKLKPFEGANNRTSVLVLKKGEKTTYPVPYFVWRKKKKTGLDENATLDVILASTIRIALSAAPLTTDLKSPWATAKPEALSALRKVVY